MSVGTTSTWSGSEATPESPTRGFFRFRLCRLERLFPLLLVTRMVSDDNDGLGDITGTLENTTNPSPGVVPDLAAGVAVYEVARFTSDLMRL